MNAQSPYRFAPPQPQGPPSRTLTQVDAPPPRQMSDHGVPAQYTLIDRLIENAAHNERVMQRLLELEMSLMTANGLLDLIGKITIGMRARLELDAVGLALVDPQEVLRDLLQKLGRAPCRQDCFVLIRDPRVTTPDLTMLTQPRLEAFDIQRHGWILPRCGLRRIACLPLRRPDGLVGYLFLGSRDRGRFVACDATELLQRLGLVAALAVQNAVNAERLRLASLMDPLTGLFNRRMLQSRLEEETERAKRYGQSVSCLFIDLDHFKRINDSHGHAGGDSVLRALGEFLKKTLRASDFATRYGGEEFALILPQTDAIEALRLAERIRAGIESLQIRVSNAMGEACSIKITASIGVATLTPGAHSITTDCAHGLVARADQSVYAAKRAGRNKVIAESEATASQANVNTVRPMRAESTALEHA